MKFQNPSLNSVLTGRTDGRTDKPKPICSPLFQSWGHKNNFLPGMDASILVLCANRHFTRVTVTFYRCFRPFHRLQGWTG